MEWWKHLIYVVVCFVMLTGGYFVGDFHGIFGPNPRKDMAVYVGMWGCQIDYVFFKKGVFDNKELRDNQMVMDLDEFRRLERESTPSTDDSSTPESNPGPMAKTTGAN